MAYNTILSIILLPIIIFILHHLLKISPKTKLPPGPKPWPIIGNIHLLGSKPHRSGNIHLLGSKPHRSVTELSKKYGPLMTLKLGSITTVVISSPEIAKEMFSKHDLVFSSRHIPDAIRVLGHTETSMIWLPVGPKWRDLRKIAAVQLFTAQRLDAGQDLRRKKMEELVEFAKGCCEKGVAIDIGKAAFTTSLNLLSNMIFSMDLCSYDSSGSQEFWDVVSHLMEVSARPNISDFFPLLRSLDLQGVRRRAYECFGKMLGIFDKIIEERLRAEMGAPKDDVLGTLLNLVKEDQLSLDDVKHMLVVISQLVDYMVPAGTMNYHGFRIVNAKKLYTYSVMFKCKF